MAGTKIPTSKEIIEIAENIKSVLPQVSSLVQKFNKDIKVKDAVDFSQSFPLILNTFINSLWQIDAAADLIDNNTFTRINEFVWKLTLRDKSDKPITDKDGNPLTVFTPIGSMITSISTMLNAVDMGTFIKLPVTMKMIRKTFEQAFKLMENIMDDNWQFLKKIKTDETVKTVIETEKEKKTEEQIKPGTGGIFKELSLVFKSVSDIQDTIIKMAKNALKTIASIKIFNTVLEKMKEPFKRMVNFLSIFSQEGGLIDGVRMIFDKKKAKEINSNWEIFNKTIQGVFNSFMLLGLKSIIVIIAFLPIRLAFWLMTDILIPAANKLFEKMSEKDFNKNLREATITTMIVGATLLTMAAVLYVSTQLVRLNFEDMMLGLGELILGLGLVVILLKLINQFLKPADLMKATASLAILTGAILMMVGTLWLISMIKTKYLGTAMLGLIGLSLFSVGLLFLLKFVQIGVNEVLGGWKDIAKTMITLTLSVLLMAGVLWVIDKMFKEVPIKDILVDLLILGACAGVVIGILYMVKNAQIDIQTLIAVGVMTLSIIGIAYAISLVTESVNEGMDLVAIGAFVVATMALVGMFVAVGMIIETGVGGAAIYLACAAFMAIGVATLMIASSFKIIIDAISDLVDLLKDTDSVTKALENFPTILNAFVNAITSVSIGTIMKAVVKANALAVAIGPASNAIGSMVNVIKEMADGEFEFNDPDNPGEKKTLNILEMMNSGLLDKIGENLTNLISGFATAIASIDWATCKRVMNREDFMESLADAVGPVYQLVDMVKSMAEGTVEVDGEEVNFVEWINSNQDKITLSIQTMIRGFLNAMSMGMGLKGASKFWSEFEDYMDEAEDGLDEVPKVVELLVDMSSNLLDICSSMDELLKTESFTNFSLYLGTMCNGLVGWYNEGVFSKIDDIEDVVETLVDISEDMNELSANLENLNGKSNAFDEFVNGNVRFVESVNKLDTSKANALANVFEKLADLSESLNGNFDKLAEAISDKLINTLQQLNDTISETNNSSSGIGGTLRRMVGGEQGGGILDSIANMFSSDDEDDSKEREHKEKVEELLEKLYEEIQDINDVCTEGVAVKYTSKQD